MNRLTYWTDRGYVCIEGCTAKYGPTYRPKANLNNAIIRLAAYEDTGLEPEEVKKIVHALEHYLRAEAALKGGEATMTNANRIRTMNDNELAKFMFEVNDMCPPGESWNECPKGYITMLTCIECWSKWLRLPAEGGPNE